MQMNQIKTGATELSAENIKAELIRLFDNSLSLRASYLIHRRRESKRVPFSPEDLAQFVLWLLIHNFEGSGDIPALPEIIVRFLTGDVQGSRNALEATLKATYFDNKPVFSEFEWDEFYYLHLLPAKNLFHLTNAREKVYAASICSKITSETKATPKRSNTCGTELDGMPSILDYYTEQSTEKFIAMSNSTVNSSHRFSITICGFHRAMMGLGEDARRLFDMLTGLGFRVELFDCSRAILENDPAIDYYRMFETRLPCSEVVIFCMPLFEMARLLPNFSESFFSSRYIVGYWPWELSSFPVGWQTIMDLADEIWASSKFLTEVYQNSSNRPVYHVPLCVEVGNDRSYDLASEVLWPESTSFLTVFDFNSTIQRKNPVGSIRAFKMAFARSDYDVQLVLKGLHGEMNPGPMQSVLDEIDGDPRIIMVDGPVSRASLNGLIEHSSALLSLHRSEGFGRLLVEAMLLRTPVVATGWSGSSDYINSENAFPVNFYLRKVGMAEYPYASGEWAEPDLEHAADLMKSVADNRGKWNSITDRAFSFVNFEFSSRKITEIISDRMNSIRAAFFNQH